MDLTLVLQGLFSVLSTAIVAATVVALVHYLYLAIMHNIGYSQTVITVDQGAYKESYLVWRMGKTDPYDYDFGNEEADLESDLVIEWGRMGFMAAEKGLFLGEDPVWMYKHRDAQKWELFTDASRAFLYSHFKEIADYKFSTLPLPNVGPASAQGSSEESDEPDEEPVQPDRYIHLGVGTSGLETASACLRKGFEVEMCDEFRGTEWKALSAEAAEALLEDLKSHDGSSIALDVKFRRKLTADEVLKGKSDV